MLWTQDGYVYELIVVAKAYTRHVQALAGPNPSMERGVGHEIPSLAVEPLAAISWWETQEDCL